jgi:hypothetical protein
MWEESTEVGAHVAPYGVILAAPGAGRCLTQSGGFEPVASSRSVGPSLGDLTLPQGCLGPG